MKFSSQIQAQGLLETIIALGIIVTGVVTSLSLAQVSLSFIRESREKLTVVNLAREGIEVTRAIRDSSRLDKTKNWPLGLFDGDWIVNYNTESLIIAVDNPIIENCTNCQLYTDGQGRYSHNPGTQTIFKRMVTVSSPSEGEKKILSQVQWEEGGRKHIYELEERLMKWR